MLRRLLVDADDDLASAALEGVVAVVGVDEKPVDGNEQERAKTPSPSIRRLQIVLLDQQRKEFLGQVFSVMRAEAALADVCVHRISVESAEAFQGRAAGGRYALLRERDVGPGCRAEARIRGGVTRFVEFTH